MLELARENVEANSALFTAGGDAAAVVEVQPLSWGQQPAEPYLTLSDEERAEGGRLLDASYDWVVGSDVTYSPGAHAPLCATFADVLARARGAGRACRAVLAHEHRVSSAGAPDARLARFREAATAAGLRVETLTTETESGRGVSVLEVKLVSAP